MSRLRPGELSDVKISLDNGKQERDNMLMNMSTAVVNSISGDCVDPLSISSASLKLELPEQTGVVASTRGRQQQDNRSKLPPGPELKQQRTLSDYAKQNQRQSEGFLSDRKSPSACLLI